MDRRANDFLADLRAVMKRHKVTAVEVDEYDGEENHAGTSVVFKGDGVYITATELAATTGKRRARRP